MENAQESKNMETQEGTVPALRRAVRILDFVGSTSVPPTAAELTRALNLPKSTAHGLVSAMVELGLLSRSTHGIYRLGPHLMKWANSFLTQFDLVEEFQRYFVENSALNNHTITLSVLEGREIMYVACRQSDAPLGFTFRIGMRLPAPFTATGKALLSALSDEDLKQLFDNDWPQAMTTKSVRNLEALRQEIELIRQRGYSIDDGQIRDGMFCIGVPIQDFSGKPVAGIAVSLIENEALPETVQRVSAKLQSIASMLSGRMGTAAG